MNTINVALVFVNGSDTVLDVDAMQDNLRSQCSEYQAKQTANWDVIAPAIEELIAVDSKCVSYPTSLFATAAKRAALADLASKLGRQPSLSEEAALVTRIESALPEYLKSEGERFFVQRGKGGVKCRQSIAQRNNGEARMSDEEWSKITAPPAPKPKKDAGDKTDASTTSADQAAE